jgi:hypothetical protein
MRKISLILLGLIVFACMVSPINAVVIPWPDWSQATSYIDNTEEVEVTHPSEDMTVCYVAKSDTFLFFRAVFLGTSPPERALDIYLDTVAGGQTGSDKGHSLHDLAADYKVFYGSAPANLYRWNGTTWQLVSPIAYRTPDSNSVELAVELASIGDPAFPIRILFISSTEADATDWNSDVGHLLYPRIVGGTVYQTQAWFYTLGAAAPLSLCAALLLVLRRRQR